MNKKDFYKNFYSDIKLSDDEKNFILNDLHKQLSDNKYQNRFFKTPQFKAAISLVMSICIITSAITYNQSSHKHDLINNQSSDTSCEQTTVISDADNNIMTSTPPAVDNKDNTASAETKEFINTTVADENKTSISNNFIGSDDDNFIVTTVYEDNINYPETRITQKNPDETYGDNETSVITDTDESASAVVTNPTTSNDNDVTEIVTTKPQPTTTPPQPTTTPSQIITTATQLVTTYEQPATTEPQSTTTYEQPATTKTQYETISTTESETTTTMETTTFVYSEPSAAYETSPPPDTLTNPE